MRRQFFIFITLLLVSSSSPAIIFYSTGDPAHNTNAPTGSLENSGWQWQGEWNKGSTTVAQYLGTPIASHYFITAHHLGVNTNTESWVFIYQGTTYKVIQSYSDDPTSDLHIWKVDKAFDSYAPLYTTNNESGQGCVVFGRGKIRGDEVVSTRTNGWLWGSLDNKMRWGTNKITSAGGYLISEFDGGGNEECATADKDSGGAVFIKDAAGVWRLAGINYYVDPAQFSTNSSGSNAFYAACFDYKGLYYYNGSWLFASSGGPAKKQQLYATRISARYSWITNVIGNELDQDVDLLPDWWEKTYANNVTSIVASADSDSDGFTNLQEYLADTNPTNSASFFEIDSFATEADQTVAFVGSTARQYQVFYATNNLTVTNLSWIAAHTNKIRGTGTNSFITVTNTDDKAFYRLKVNLP